MAHKVKRKKTKSIVVITNEVGHYVYHEIDFRAFQFDQIDFRFDDKESDMRSDLAEAATINEN